MRIRVAEQLRLSLRRCCLYIIIIGILGISVGKADQDLQKGG
ncbi:MAG: hypothetical protein ACLVEX_00225 [Ruthenibacterium lactatiformans]